MAIDIKPVTSAAEELKFKAEAEAYKAEAKLNLALARKHAAEAEQAEYAAAAAAINLLDVRRSEEIFLAGSGENRLYHFNSGVSQQTADLCINQLSRWHRVDVARGNPDREYEIIFNSPGGGVTAGMALFDHIRYISSLGHKITTGSLGYAASMGAILLQAGDHRWMGKEAYLMIHEISAGTGGKVGEMKDDVKFYEMVCARIVQLFVERSGKKITPTQFKKNWERIDWWIESNEALKLGFVDEVH
jgi:ATP-dependent Clp endopeptidase proteolytic subunit ClpP